MLYEEFLVNNQKNVNQYLNRVLWCCVAAGPVLGFGVYTGWFHGVTYQTSLLMTSLILVVTVLHSAMMNYWPHSVFTSVVPLFAVDILLLFASLYHVGIRMTWFLTPLLSILFCDFRIYAATVIVNYICMMMSTWFLSPFYATLRSDFVGKNEYFISYGSGYTLETVILLIAGYRIVKLASMYFRDLMEKNIRAEGRERRIKEQMELLNSMAGIYENVNLLDFTNMTERPLNGTETEQHSINLDIQTQTRMNQQLNGVVAQDQLTAFKAFTNIATLKMRLHSKKSIYGEFFGQISGWFRAQYITVEQDPYGMPTKVIYTIQNIDNEKRREEHLLRISLTDGLTHLHNRRCYEEDVVAFSDRKLPEDLVLFSVDVNDLKTTNDTLGHAAGDELILGAAECLIGAIAYAGKIYRMGGDEFFALLHTPDAEEIKHKILKRTEAWHGTFQSSLSLAVGYACVADMPNVKFSELERMADSRMYVEKEKHYLELGTDRKGQPSAFSALCSDCIKIVKVNLITDTFNTIRMDMKETDREFGYSKRVSEWLEQWPETGMIHPDDVTLFKEKMNVENIRSVFASGQRKMNFFYRRKKGDDYCRTLVEIVGEGPFDEENQRLYISVKEIEGYYE